MPWCWIVWPRPHHQYTRRIAALGNQPARFRDGQPLQIRLNVNRGAQTTLTLLPCPSPARLAADKDLDRRATSTPTTYRTRTLSFGDQHRRWRHLVHAWLRSHRHPAPQCAAAIALTGFGRVSAVHPRQRSPPAYPGGEATLCQHRAHSGSDRRLGRHHRADRAWWRGSAPAWCIAEPCPPARAWGAGRIASAVSGPQAAIGRGATGRDRGLPCSRHRRMLRQHDPDPQPGDRVGTHRARPDRGVAAGFTVGRVVRSGASAVPTCPVGRARPRRREWDQAASQHVQAQCDEL